MLTEAEVALVETHLLQMAPDAMIVVDQSGRILRANALAERLFGYPPGALTGQSLDSIVPKWLRDRYHQHFTAYLRHPCLRPMNTGQMLSGLRRDGSEFAADISLNPLPTPTGIHVLAAIRDASDHQRAQAILEQASAGLERQVAARNAELLQANAELRRQIAERMQAEAALRETEALYRDLVENQPDLICRYLPDTTLTFVNAAYARFFGRKPEELIGQRFIEFLCAEDREEVWRQMAAFTPAAPARQYEHKTIRMDGAVRWHLWHDFAFFDERGKATGFQCIGIDVTEHKQAEARLQTTNRALQLRSACNQSLVQAINEVVLLAEICRLIIEVGGYRFAWVGFAEHDEARTVRPVWQAGYESNYLASVRITWSDDESGEGPTGTAIRTGRPAVVRNLMTDPHYAPWRVRALECGFASSIALPLIVEGQIDGALNIYAAEPDAFTAEEIQLLGKLADDVAYGLSALRVRARQQRMAVALQESEERFRHLAEAAFEGIAVSRQGRLIDVNQQLADMLGYVPAELIGREILNFVDPEARELVQTRLQTGILEPVEHMLQRKDGSTFPVEVRVRTALYRGEMVRISAIRDITERKRAEEALRESAERLKLALQAANAGAWEWNIATGRTIWSDENYRVMGLVPGSAEACYANWLRCVHPDDRTETQRRVAESMEQGGELNIEFRVVWPNGDIRWLQDIGKIQYDPAGNVIGLYGIQMDITARKQAEEALFEAKERAQVTLHSIGDAVITTDANAIIEYLNPVAEALTGWTMAEACGRPLSEVFHIISEQTRQPAPDPVARCLQEGKIVGLANHTVLIDRHGREYHIADSAAPIRGRDGRVLGVVLVFHDVTENRRLTRQLEYDATHDALTGLINRVEFERRLERALTSAQQYGSRHALCYMDLDQFKIVNDTAGHAAGDELLRQIHTILSGMFRERDTLARIGGDEFGLLLDNCPLERAQTIAQAVVSNIHSHRFHWEGRTYQIGVSIGLVPITAEVKDTAQLLTQADVACYIAKETGRNRVHLYQRENGATALRHSEILGAAGLRDAMEQGRFRLYYQPIVPLDAPDCRPVRYEVLLRVVYKGSPEENSELVLPAVFIPAAERYGLMNAIDRWVIQTAFREYANGVGLTGARISINLSGNSLSDETLLGFIETQFAEHAFPPAQICFEITETATIQNLRQALELMAALKRRGSQFALDDFGSGLSSFHYLKTLPIDFLKIDGSFIKDMIGNASDYALVAAINQMSHTMGIQTIAEYVHSLAIVERLREMGVDYAQGYFFGEPTPWGKPS